MSPEKQAILLQRYGRLFAGQLTPGTPDCDATFGVRDGWFTLLNDLCEFLVKRYAPADDQLAEIAATISEMETHRDTNGIAPGFDDDGILAFKNRLKTLKSYEEAFLKDCIRIERLGVDGEGRLHVELEYSTAHQLVAADAAAIHMTRLRSASVCEVCEQRGFLVSPDVPKTLCPEHILKLHGGRAMLRVADRESKDSSAIDFMCRYLPRGRSPRVAVLAIEESGLTILVSGARLQMPYSLFPWFRGADPGHIRNVEMSESGHLYWPDLDVDLHVDSIEDPDLYPLTSRESDGDTR